MNKCDRCANQECIESCIDCVCAECIYHMENDACELGGLSDWFEEDARGDDGE